MKKRGAQDHDHAEAGPVGDEAEVDLEAPRLEARPQNEETEQDGVDAQDHLHHAINLSKMLELHSAWACRAPSPIPGRRG